MLSEDLTGGLRTGIGATGAIIRGVVKGAIIGALVAVAGVAIVAAAAPVWGIIAGTATFHAGMAAAGTAIVAKLGTWAAAAGIGALGAKIGAAVLGATSIIPSVREWPGMFKKTVSVPSRVIQYSEDVAHSAAPKITAKLEETMDNPYFEEGKGARLAARGDQAQPAVTRA